MATTTRGLESLKKYEISAEEFRTFSDRIDLTFEPSNKELFQVNEEVSLKMMIKNIQQLTVKIFEFNTETYYLKKLEAFRSDVNLEGLEASETEKHNFD
jgi:hypothetical protein